MSARILEFPKAKCGGARDRSALVEPADHRLTPPKAVLQDFEFWCGVSGARYVHSVFSLLECPELPRSTYVLVRRDSAGRRHSLRIGRLESDAPSLNLAEVRHLGATLGANEVHVHMLAESEIRRRLVELDLSAAEGCEIRRRAANS